MRIHIKGYHMPPHHVSGHHVNGYMKKLPHSHKKVRIGGHHRMGHHTIGHKVIGHFRVM